VDNFSHVVRSENVVVAFWLRLKFLVPHIIILGGLRAILFACSIIILMPPLLVLQPEPHAGRDRSHQCLA